MTIGLAITIYTSLVAVVASLLLYYFRVMRPNEEKQSND